MEAYLGGQTTRIVIEKRKKKGGTLLYMSHSRGGKNREKNRVNTEGRGERQITVSEIIFCQFKKKGRQGRGGKGGTAPYSLLRRLKEEKRDNRPTLVSSFCGKVSRRGGERKEGCSVLLIRRKKEKRDA